MWKFLFLVIACAGIANTINAQISSEKETAAYQYARRDLVPNQWYLHTAAMLRVTLKKDGENKKLSLDSLSLNAQLDSIVSQGYTAIEIFATPHGGKSFGGLDAIDRYAIDPAAGNMSDFRRLVRQAHLKGLAVIAFDNLGYSSVDAPHFLKACEDVAKGKRSKEAKWFSWADSDSAPPPMKPDAYYLGGTRRWEKWVYSPVAKKYYWSKWDGVDKNGKKCSLPQYNWTPEWQQEVKNIVHFWMNTGIDGMVIDAVNWYINYTWQMGKECITDIIASYGNVFMQPEGAGGFHEDPVPWITEGGWNCVQNYGLGIWWEDDNNLLVNAINRNNPSGIEEALQSYRDRVVAENGVLYIGADLKIKDPAGYYLYVAFSVASGHIYCKSMRVDEKFSGDKKLLDILKFKSHSAFSQIGRRQKLTTSDETKYYAFVQKSHDERERILCIFNFQDKEQDVNVDLSGVDASTLSDLAGQETYPYKKQFDVKVPALGFRFFKINGQPPYNEQYRPQVHFSPKKKWINDPNGLVYHEGVYHMFFQYYPDSVVWGPMHWGHATSADLIHWKEQPVVLYPDSIGYIFSGSAVVDKANTSGFGSAANPPLVAIYSQHDAKNEKSLTHQTQSVAYSLDNGKTFTKYGKNPVLPNPGHRGFRDPKVMWHEESGKWHMTLTIGGRVVFYTSDNLKSWEKVGDFGDKVGAHGGGWECPDLFPVTVNGEKIWVLIASLYPGGLLEGGSGTQYFIGRFDGKKFEPFDNKIRWLDYGPDNYATITWSNVKDRIVALGWMNNWLYAPKVPEHGWRGAMTLPREMGITSIQGEYYLTSEFVREIKTLYADSVDLHLSGARNVRVGERFGKLTGSFRLDLQVDGSKDFRMEFTNGRESVIVGFDAGSARYYIDRSKGGNHSFHDSFNKIQYASRIVKNNNIELSVVVDHSSVEVLADRGVTALTALCFPQEPFNDVILSSAGGLTGMLSVKTLHSIWR